MFAYIVSYCAVEILYDLLVLFSFGFLCLKIQPEEEATPLFDVVSESICLEVPLSSP